ncbi:hypothetical protein SAMN04487969_14149 [Paenibacillus algorifonticola]|uniref:Uncharacterized protein n=1 Tax=Paenibacillus algorifonticola TaxID=684063 RepID=A0A1I2IWN8_9BACL|nr:hypothetical protein SAMN04487969_14149 [Paenibacillus algorifonticola]
MDKYAKPGCKSTGSKKARSEEELALIRRQSHERMTELEHHVLVCQGRCCAKRGSQAVCGALKGEKDRGARDNRVRVNSSAECVGR